MKNDIDFTKLSNSEINIKMKSFEYNVKKSKILSLINDLQELDYLYIKAKGELEKRGVLNNG